MRQPPPESSAPTNAILAALPAGEYQRLAPHLSEVELKKGQILHEEGQPPQGVYFLTEGMAVLSISGAEGKSLEMSVVGNEGIVGERAVFEGGMPLIRCSMVTDGRGYKLPPAVLHDEFYEGGKLHDLVMRVVEARIMETSQNALCNQTHPVEQRLSRWLLMMADRTHRDTLPLTHEEVAELLGVRRSGITVAAGTLQDAGLIKMTRGQITIVDRKGLEAHTCECHEIVHKAVKRAYSRTWHQ